MTIFYFFIFPHSPRAGDPAGFDRPGLSGLAGVVERQDKQEGALVNKLVHPSGGEGRVGWGQMTLSGTSSSKVRVPTKGTISTFKCTYCYNVGVVCHVLELPCHL